MKKKVYKINKYFLFSFLFLFYQFFVAGITQGQTKNNSAGIRLEAGIVTSESELELRISATSHSPVNAFDIELQYDPDYFEFLRASTDRSVVDFWQSFPLKARDGSIELVGGMIEPLSNQGELITLIFHVKKSGTTEFVMRKGNFALANRKGTAISVPETRSSITIVQNGAEEFARESLPAPRIAEVNMATDPIEKVTVLSVETENNGAVEEIWIRSRKWVFWSDWQKSQLTTAIPRFAWMMHLVVVSWDGNRQEKIIYRWEIFTWKLLLIFVVIVGLIGLWYGAWRVKKRIQN